jgi:hypothetical protein
MGNEHMTSVSLTDPSKMEEGQAGSGSEAAGCTGQVQRFFNMFQMKDSAGNVEASGSQVQMIVKQFTMAINPTFQYYNTPTLFACTVGLMMLAGTVILFEQNRQCSVEGEYKVSIGGLAEQQRFIESVTNGTKNPNVKVKLCTLASEAIQTSRSDTQAQVGSYREIHMDQSCLGWLDAYYVAKGFPIHYHWCKGADLMNVLADMFRAENGTVILHHKSPRFPQIGPSALPHRYALMLHNGMQCACNFPILQMTSGWFGQVTDPVQTWVKNWDQEYPGWQCEYKDTIPAYKALCTADKQQQWAQTSKRTIGGGEPYPLHCGFSTDGTTKWNNYHDGPSGQTPGYKHIFQMTTTTCPTTTAAIGAALAYTAYIELFCTVVIVSVCLLLGISKPEHKNASLMGLLKGAGMGQVLEDLKDMFDMPADVKPPDMTVAVEAFAVNLDSDFIGSLNVDIGSLSTDALFEKSFEQLVTKAKNHDGGMSAFASKIPGGSSTIKRMAIAVIKPKLEPKLKKRNILWEEFAPILTNITLQDLQTCAGNADFTPLFEKVMSNSRPLAKKLVRELATATLQREFENLKKKHPKGQNEEIKWEDFEPICKAALDPICESIEQMLGEGRPNEPVDVKGIMQKFKDPGLGLAKKWVLAKLKPHLKKKFEEKKAETMFSPSVLLEWDDFFPLLASLWDKLVSIDLSKLDDEIGKMLSESGMENIFVELKKFGRDAAKTWAIAHARRKLEDHLKEKSNFPPEIALQALEKLLEKGLEKLPETLPNDLQLTAEPSAGITALMKTLEWEGPKGPKATTTMEEAEGKFVREIIELVTTFLTDPTDTANISAMIQTIQNYVFKSENEDAKVLRKKFLAAKLGPAMQQGLEAPDFTRNHGMESIRSRKSNKVVPET